MSKISQYGAITNVQDDDVLVVVDVHDGTMAPSGTTKKMTLSQLPAPVAADYAPTGLTGATAASRYVGGTASGAPASGTFAVGDFVVDQSGKVWVCTAAGSPGTWTAAGAALDGTAADIQPLGVAAAGNKGQAADAKHVHPWQPWQFAPEAYGAKGDGKVITDATIGSGNLSQLTSASAAFTSADTGKHILVAGAGPSGGYLATTITYVSATSVTLAAAATAAVTNAGALYGTDDTAAINSAVAAAAAYAGAHHQYAEIVFLAAMYVVAGAATVGGSTQGNAQIPLPIVSATAAAKMTLVFRGLCSDAGTLMHWTQPTVQAGGAVLACLRLDGTNDVTYGPASVIGGPYHGYGGAEPGTFSNLQPVIDSLSILVPFNSAFSGFDFWGCAEALVRSASVMPMATIASGTAWPQASWSAITNQYTAGLRMPSAGNNDRCDIGYFACEGLCYGLMPSEHTTWASVRVIQCIIGIEGYSGNGVNMVHGIRGTYASVESCDQALGGFDGGVKIDIDTIDVENITNVVYDPGAHLQGSIGVRGFGPGYSLSGMYQGATGLGVRAVNLDNAAGPVASPQAPPASGSAWFNGYYRDAWITLAATSITGLSIDSTAQHVPSGATAFSFLLPAGHSYAPTYTGTLTHTVSLL